MTTAAILNGAGARHAREGVWDSALDSFRAAVQADPEAAAYRNNACVAALKLGLLDEALSHGRAAVLLDPSKPAFAANLARVFDQRREDAEAALYYARALEAGGDSSLYLRLGTALSRTSRFVAAARAFEAALTAEPNDEAARHALASALCSAGEVDRALELWETVVRRRPDLEKAWEAYLLALHYSENRTPQRIFEEHRRWGGQTEQRISEMPPAPRSARASRIRIGYLSAQPDAAAPFAAALYRHHDRGVFDVLRYSAGQEMTNSEVTAMIRRAEIDILVDLAGHASRAGRLQAMAARPARLHVTMIGYPDTTGLSRIDYRVTDGIADPEGAEVRHTEKLLRLNPCFLCYTPPADAPDVAPRDPGAPFTFGCFNGYPKITTSAVRAWSRILSCVPDSRLIVKCLEFADPDVRSRGARRFDQAGADMPRVDLRAPSPDLGSHLAVYRDVDFFLDCFPYNGATTTCEAMWMGVPGVTLAGVTHASRVGASLLAACRFESHVAAGWDEYAACAVDAARERDTIRASRPTLRARLLKTPLLDGARYTRQFEERLLNAFEGADPRSSTTRRRPLWSTDHGC